MATVKEILVRIRSDSSGLQSDLSKAGSTLTSWGRKTSQVGRTLTRNVSLPLLAVGGVATKMALDFDRSFTTMQTLAGVSAKEVAGLKREVLGLAGETAKAPQDLAESLYFIRSSGFEGAAAMDILTVSAKAAAAGLGDTVTVADAVTSAMNAYGPKTLSAAQATDTLIGAVRQGKGEASEIGAVIGRVIPLASELGVTFQDVGAATAAMTLSGLDAAEATTALRGIFTSLLKPTSDGEDALKKYGFTAEGLRNSLGEKGLFQTLMEVKTALGDNKTAMADIFPNVRALAGFLNLTGQNAGKNAKIFSELAGAVGETDKAFDKVQKSAGFKFDKALNNLRIAAIKLGNQLIPILTDTIIPAIQDALRWWKRLSPETKTLALKLAGLAILAGPLLRLGGALMSVAGGMAKFVPWLMKAGSGTAAKGAANLAAGAGGTGAGISTAGSLAAVAVFAKAAADGWSMATGDMENYFTKLTNWEHFLNPLSNITVQNPFEGLSDMGSFKEGFSAIRAELSKGKADIQGARDAIADLAEATNVTLPDGALHAAQALAITSDSMRSQFLPVLHDAGNITTKERGHLIDLANAIAKGGGALDKNTAAQLRNVLSLGDAGAAARVLKGVLGELAERHHHAGEEAKVEAAKAGDLGNQLKSIPSHVSTKVTADTSQAKAALANLFALYGNKTLYWTVAAAGGLGGHGAPPPSTPTPPRGTTPRGNFPSTGRGVGGSTMRGRVVLEGSTAFLEMHLGDGEIVDRALTRRMGSE